MKATNYTESQTKELVKEYTSATSDEERKCVMKLHAVKLDKTQKSIISKLSREGVYVSAKIVTPKRVSPTKEDYINHVAIMLNIRDISRLDSLNKASLQALRLVSEHLNTMNDAHDVKKLNV
jgi:hypothetical protein